jgi:alpha-galactosidase
VQPQIELTLKERIVPIIEGIVNDTGYIEEAVNIPNRGFIADLPAWLAVEVPARVDKAGVHGVALGELPPGYAGLLLNQVAIHYLTAQAVLQRSKAIALQALLVDPIVSQCRGIDELLDTMIAYQERWLGYLK